MDSTNQTRLPACNIVFISDKINTRVVSNIIEQEVYTPETVKDTFASVHGPPGGSTGVSPSA